MKRKRERDRKKKERKNNNEMNEDQIRHKIKLNKKFRDENWKLTKVIKASKAKEREIKRMMMKIDININWRTHLIFKKASVKIKVRREKREGGRKGLTGAQPHLCC